LDDEICHSPVECPIWEDGVGGSVGDMFYKGIIHNKHDVMYLLTNTE